MIIFKIKPVRCHSLDVLNKEYLALGQNTVSLDLELRSGSSWRTSSVND